MIILTHVSQPEAEMAHLGKLTSSIERAHDCRNGIWNNFTCLVKVSVYSSIYLNVKDCETEKKMHTEYDQKKMAAA